MLLNEYSIKSKKYESLLDPQEKKNKGIYYTDTNLTSKIVEFLNIPYSASIYDPCCGTGNFIMSAKCLGYMNLYGSDSDAKAISCCKKNTLISNVFTLDTISNNGDYILKKIKIQSKLDFVIGNPPYVPITKDLQIDMSDYLFWRSVKDSGNNLFVAAIYRAFELVKEEGVISYIIPKNFLHVSSYSILRKFILSKKTVLSIVDIGSRFKDVRGEQIILTIQNKPSSSNVIKFYKFENEEFIKQSDVPQNFYTDEILIFTNDIDFNIYKKIQSSYKNLGDVCTGYLGRGKSKSEIAITGKDIRKFSFKSCKVPQKGNQIFIQNIYSAEAGIIASFAGNLEASETVTVFTDGDEKMCRYVLGVLHSRLVNYFLQIFCYNNSKLTMHTDAKYLKRIPLIINDKTFTKIINLVMVLEEIDYMSECWFDFIESLNEIIYNTYGITKEERLYIDSKIKSIQSEKWNYDKRR